jgi:DNA polymerase
MLAREPARFALLYRLVWRAHVGERVLDLALDRDVEAARRLALAVRAEAHRMRTHLRFLRVEGADGPRLVGWYAPEHFVLEADAQLIAARFPAPDWSILTPDGAAHCAEGALRFGAGIAPPADDAALAALWRAHGKTLLADAAAGTSIPAAEPLDEAPRPPDRPPLGPVVRHRSADPTLAEAAAEAAACRRCPLWESATQTVFGEGPRGARLLFVGEQPGDQEDIIGRPFVGPAGQILDQALEEAGIDRRAIYITNAVKHFKFVRRGRRRIHERPETPEMHACAFWLDVERVRIAPRLTVLMGATAARSVLGRPVTITRERGRRFDLAPGVSGFITVHPSFLLRAPDEESRAREYRAFVADLREVSRIAGGGS